MDRGHKLVFIHFFSHFHIKGSLPVREGGCVDLLEPVARGHGRRAGLRVVVRGHGRHGGHGQALARTGDRRGNERAISIS